MSAVEIRTEFVAAVPALPCTPNTFFYVKGPTDTTATFWKSSKDGTEIFEIKGKLVEEAAVSQKLKTPRRINGVLFDGTADITITGGSATDAAKLTTARQFGISGAGSAAGVNFDGTGNVDLVLTSLDATKLYGRVPNASLSGSYTVDITGNASGNAGTATKLQTARLIGGVSFDGTANINLPGVNAAGNQNTTGSAAKLTTPRLINGTSFDGSVDVTTANWGTARTLTIGSTGKSVNGSANVAWTLAEIGAAAASHTHQWTDLPYTPVRQGGGTEQGTNNILIGFGTSAGSTPNRLRLMVDSTDYGASWPISVTGNATSASSASKLTTPRNLSLAGAVVADPVAFDGSADVSMVVQTLDASKLNGLVPRASLGGTYDINITGTTGAASSAVLADAAVKLQTARLIGGVSFDGTANINLPGVNAAGNQNTTGSAATLTTARTIALSGAATGTATSFNGSANITIPVTALNADSLSSGTVPNARLSGLYDAMSLKLSGANTIFTVPSTGSPSASGRTAYGLGEYKGNASETGAIVFIAPVSSMNVMHTFEVTIVNGSVRNKLFIIGSRAVDGSWSNMSMTSIGPGAPYQVRWGTNAAGRAVLVIGDVNSTWSYAQVSITRGIFGQSGATDAYVAGWSTGLVTDIGAYTSISASLALDPINTAITGNAASATLAASATKLATARTIGGVSFDGTANINLPGVNAAGTQNTTGSAATLTTARTIALNGGVTGTATAFNGSANITIPVTAISADFLTGIIMVENLSGSYAIDITGNALGNAGSATKLATARTIGGVSFDGTANINLPGVNAVGNQNTTGSAATLTTARTIALSGAATGTATSFNGSANITIPVTALNASNLTAGTVPNARMAGQYDGITLALTGTNTVFSTPSTGTVSGLGRTVHSLAEFRSGTVNTTGAIVFIAPAVANDAIHQFEITGNDGIDSAGSFRKVYKANIAVYRSGAGAFTAMSHVSMGNTQLQVRFGQDSTGKTCVILGNDTTVWRYPHISIGLAMLSHTPITDAFASGWTTALVSNLSFSGYTAITADVPPDPVDVSVLNAMMANTLTTPRLIGGVSFDGSADIVLPGVNAAGNQSTSGNAATATKLATARTIGGVSFDGTTNINLPGVNTAGNQNTTGSAATLATARTIALSGGVTGTATSFNGSANITIPVTSVSAASLSGTIPTANLTGSYAIDVTGSAATLSTARTIALSGAATGTATSFNGSANITIPVTALNASNLTAGTVPNARLTGTYDGITIKLNATNTVYSTPSTGSQNANGRTAVLAAEFRGNFFTDTTGGTGVGMIAFIAPANISNAVYHLVIEGQNGILGLQDPGEIGAINIRASTYRVSSTNHQQNYVQQTGMAAPLVRFGSTSDDKFVIILGDTTTGWGAPHLALSLALVSGDGVTTDTIASGWTTAFLTSLTGFKGLVTPSVVSPSMNADSAQRLAVARLIGGVSFDGTANINLPGVNAAGNQSTSGNAATATALQTARTIGGVSFNGTANINLPGVNTAGNQNTTGSAATLTTARTIALSGGVTGTATSFNGSANITIPVTSVAATSLSGIVPAANLSGSYAIDITGSAATLTTPRTIGGVAFDGSANINLPGVNAAGNQNTTGSAATLTTARTIGLSGAATGTATSFNGSSNITIPVTALNASNLTSGTVPNAALSGTYDGVTFRLNGTNSIYSTPSTGSSNSLGRTAVALAEYRSSGSATVGAIVFIAPTNASAVMTTLEIAAREHGSGDNIMRALVSGYRGSATSNWSNTKHISLGTKALQVRLGVDPNGKACVILGDVDTTWAYPHVALLSAMFSHSGVSDAYATGWTTGLVTDLTSYTYVSADIAAATWAGASATADKLTTTRAINGTNFDGTAAITTANWGTARTLSFTGDATGSASVNGSANVAFALTLANSGVTAGEYQSVTVDAKGRVTAGKTIAASGLITSTSATGTSNVATSNTNTYINLVENVGGALSAAGASARLTGSGLTTVSSDASGVITIATPAPTTVSGNAGTATTLQTARTINGTNFDGSAAITTANWGTARTITIGNVGKSVNGSANVAWTVAEIGAVDLTTTQTVSNKTLGAGTKEANTVTTTLTISNNLTPFQQITLAANSSPTVSLAVGESRTIYLKSGSYSVTWPANVTWNDGANPTLDTSKWNLLTFTGAPGTAVFGAWLGAVA